MMKLRKWLGGKKIVDTHPQKISLAFEYQAPLTDEKIRQFAESMCSAMDETDVRDFLDLCERLSAEIKNRNTS